MGEACQMGDITRGSWSCISVCLFIVVTQKVIKSLSHFACIGVISNAIVGSAIEIFEHMESIYVVLAR